MTLYQPQEDAFILEKQVKKYAKGLVLDIGTGSGIQAQAAAKKKAVTKVLATDIQKKVIDDCRAHIQDKKITFLQSDLFKKIPKKRFNTIIFNPPYLPNEPRLKDLTLDGGKRGYEILERFLTRLSNSDFKDKFILKGGTLLAKYIPLGRETKDLDFFIDNLLSSTLAINDALEEICRIDLQDYFRFEMVKTEPLKHIQKPYPGLQIQFRDQLECGQWA